MIFYPRMGSVFLVLLLLSACSTGRATHKERDEQAKRVTTAKINTQLGMVYLKIHNVERAKQKLLSAMNQAPEIPEVWYAMGYFMEQTGNSVQAGQHYQKAIQKANRKDPEKLLSFLALARLDYNGKNFIDAKKNLDRFLALSSPTPESVLLARKLDLAVRRE